MIASAPATPLFPYTTLFRSVTAERIFSDPYRNLLYTVRTHAKDFCFCTYRRRPFQNTLEGPYLRHRTLLPQIASATRARSEEHTSELQSRVHLVCRHLLENN